MSNSYNIKEKHRAKLARAKTYFARWEISDVLACADAFDEEIHPATHRLQPLFMDQFRMVS